MKDSAIALILFGAIVVFVLFLSDIAARRFYRLLNTILFVASLTVLITLGSILSEGRSARQFATSVGYALTSSTSPLLENEDDVSRPGIRQAVISLPGNLWHYSLETLFGSYGHGSVRMVRLWYDIARYCVVLVTLGLVWSMLRRRRVMPILLLLLCVICVSLAPIIRSILSANLTLLTGRFFFPSLSAVTILIALGLFAFPSVIRRGSAMFVFAGIGLAAVTSPFITIMPTYQQPSMLDPVTTPESMQIPASITYGDSIQLLGYSLPLAKTTPGGSSLIELYWRAIKPMDKNYILRIETFSVEGQSFRERLDGFPGRNVFPTSFWKPGDTFAETYYLPVKSDVPAPSLATFKISWLDPDSGKTLTPLCEDNSACESKVGILPVMLDSSSATRWIDKPALYSIGEHADLVEVTAPTTVQAGSAITLSLIWRARSTGQSSLTTFVHVLSAEGKLVTQTDSPPRGGFYPTNVWSAGEIIPDQVTLHVDEDVPAGSYQLVIGMYDPHTGQRAPTRDSAGMALPDNAIMLQEITVR